MKLSLTVDGARFAVDTTSAIDLSIPLDFRGPQASAYGAPPACSNPHRDGDFVGSVEHGGTVNCHVISLIPHCNGTHTESVGHILSDSIPVPRALIDSFSLAALVSVSPVPSAETNEEYRPPLEPTDQIITREALVRGLESLAQKCPTALIIRTLPNTADKRERDWSKHPGAFLSVPAAQLLHELGIQHLVIDLPSVDRASDEGRLSSHRVFWDIRAGQTALDGSTPSDKTITEMVYVPDHVRDGLYLLQLEVPDLVTDAVPSRPRLYVLQKEES